MGDLIERLRLLPSDDGGPSYTGMVRERIEAADELARLRAEVRKHELWAMEAQGRAISCEEIMEEAIRERDELRRMLGKARNYLEGLEIADEIDALVRLDAEEGK